MADKFTADKLAWLDRVMLDSEITHLDFRFCYWISSRCDRVTGEATAFQDTIANALDVTPRGIQKSAQRLEDKGIIRITSRRGHGVKNSYAPVFLNPNRCSGLRTETRTEWQSNTNAGSNKYEPPSVEASLVLSQFDSLEREGRSRAKRLPNDFRLDPETYDWALSKLGSVDGVGASMFRFQNHYRSVASSKGLSNDWMAKARLWIDDDAKKSKSDKSVHAAADRLSAKIASFSAGIATDAEYEQILANYEKFGSWTRHVDQFGPPPGSPGCRVPEHLLIKFNLKRVDAA